MIAITFSGAPAFLIQCPPSWGNEVLGTFDKITSRVTGETAREDREPKGTSLRASLEYTTLLNPAQADELRALRQAWDNRPVLCPFWPAETLAANYADASVQGGLRVWWEPDWSAYSINSGTTPTHGSATAACRAAPLMVCKFAELPLSRVVSGSDDETAKISVTDNGATTYALLPKAVTLSNGASVNSVTVPLNTVPFTWGENLQTAEVRIKEATVGFGREAADTFYAQAPRTKNTLNFTALTGAEIAYIIKLFDNRSGSVSPFWQLGPQGTDLADRVFGRFYGDRLQFSWLKPTLAGECASCQIEFLSLPTELNVPSGETFGQTIGPRGGRWFGYEVVCGSNTWRYTSYESAIVGPSANTFTPQKINHGTITEEINLAVNDCTLTVHAWEGCPFAIIAQQLNAEPMTVTIYEGTIAAPADAVAIYTGNAMAPKRSGLKMTVKLRGPSAILSIRGPRMLMQETCRAILGDGRCKKDLTAFTHSIDVASVSGGIATTTTGAGTHPAGYFRNGYAERNVSGVKQRLAISDSYDDGGVLKVIIGTVALSPAVTGTETWTFKAGCDGYYTTCGSRFGNTVNFRGFPFIPRVNPTMIPVQAAETGKKS